MLTHVCLLKQLISDALFTGIALK